MFYPHLILKEWINIVIDYNSNNNTYLTEIGLLIYTKECNYNLYHLDYFLPNKNKNFININLNYTNTDDIMNRFFNLNIEFIKIYEYDFSNDKYPISLNILYTYKNKYASIIQKHIRTFIRKRAIVRNELVLKGLAEMWFHPSKMGFVIMEEEELMRK